MTFITDVRNLWPSGYPILLLHTRLITYWIVEDIRVAEVDNRRLNLEHYSILIHNCLVITKFVTRDVNNRAIAPIRKIFENNSFVVAVECGVSIWWGATRKVESPVVVMLNGAFGVVFFDSVYGELDFTPFQTAIVVFGFLKDIFYKRKWSVVQMKKMANK